MNLAILALFIGIPYGTNASMSIESFLQKRDSNNPLEQIRNPLQWKHDSKRKVSRCVKSRSIAIFYNCISSCTIKSVHQHCPVQSTIAFLIRIFWNRESPFEQSSSRQRYAEYKRSRNCCNIGCNIDCNNQAICVTSARYSLSIRL